MYDSLNKFAVMTAFQKCRLKGVNTATSLRTRRLGVLLFALLGASFSPIVSAQVITEFPVPTSSSQP
jgi:hypothetical protein